MASGFQNTNAFQNAGRYGNFTYQEIGNQSSTFVILLLALILLIALLFAERRYRSLMERFTHFQLETAKK